MDVEVGLYIVTGDPRHVRYPVLGKRRLGLGELGCIRVGKMARAAAWRQLCPPQVRALQELASLRPLFLLRQSGPTAFIVQEAEEKPVQVRLGDPHHCSCKIHHKSRELCLHICWVLLKKLRLRMSNPLSYQLGLVPRELGDLLEPRGLPRTVPRKPARARAEQQAVVARRPPQSEDLCPICLLPFGDSQLPVVHCRYGCGNAVHTRCMVQVARHQLDSQDLGTDRLLTCPLCR
ncbi:E3 ubiquitin-protein ligase ZSWIM2-like [Macrosteles quadrilineatus]|uniref:E3 ubiquitin-protein ligase ZSWIM2-like n=1 Tax=Macrosteles quadrilineatus TaxID=74068 RepID=UPI0023E19D53|nr:E3 ubiquitin-protein ligase ZSWIM2-like [Macrosteles quadrilineatus]